MFLQIISQREFIAALVAFLQVSFMLLCMVVGVDVGLWLWPDHLSPHGGLAAHYSPLPCQTHSHHQQQQEERELGSGSISRARCALDTLEGTSAQEEEGGGTHQEIVEKNQRERRMKRRGLIARGCSG